MRALRVPALQQGMKDDGGLPKMEADKFWAVGTIAVLTQLQKRCGKTLIQNTVDVMISQSNSPIELRRRNGA